MLGEHDISVSTESASVRSAITEFFIHPDYNAGTSSYDFALLKMATPINFNEVPNIRPLCLPVDTSKDYAGATATVAGWGTLEFFGSSPEKLQEVNVTVLSNSECRSSTAYNAEDILDNMLCAGDIQAGGKDSCQGDSGGPLIVTEGSGTVSGENYEIIGVVSFGIGCGLAFAPGVYARCCSHIVDCIYQ